MTLDEAYKDGLDAAYRINKYEGFKSTPPCPFEQGTENDVAWWQGFGDGTQDLVGSYELEDV